MSEEGKNKERPLTRRQQDVNRILEELPFESQEKDTSQRFGFFSIPYPSTIGDQAYSQNNESHHKVVDRKVIIENRGIYTTILKSGKGPDVYFPPPETTEKLSIQKEKDEKYRKIKDKKMKERLKQYLAKIKEKNPFPYKPPGPQNSFSFYKKLDDEKELPEPTGPLTIEADKRKYKIDHFKVLTKLRNMQAAPSKTGRHPNDYFDFYRADEDSLEIFKEMNKQAILNRIKKAKERKSAEAKIAFKPASLKLCEPFINDRSTYEAHNEEEIDYLLQKYKEMKLKGRIKYKKPPNPVQHDKPFSPAKLFFEGRSGLFMYKSDEFFMNNDIRYNKEYQKQLKKLKEKEKKTSIREIREKEKQEKNKFGKPFTYNILMKSSTFSPCISSDLVNMKKEFPSVKFY